MSREKGKEDRKAASATYIEQTKLLVTLASTFLIAPAGLLAIIKDIRAVGITPTQFCLFLWAESFFVASVLAGYVALASLAGSQDQGKFNIYRTATRVSSLLQFFLYLAGLLIFVWLATTLIT